MDKRTALYENHLAHGGKIVPFGGFELPVEYKGQGVVKEHMAVREKVGIFDVSHMGEVFYEGPDALANLNNLLTNNFTTMVDGQVRYSVMCYEDGGCVDDLIVYKFNDEKYMVVINAGNRDKDDAWMREHVFGDCTFTNASDDWSQIAVQGPLAKEVMAKICNADELPEKYYYFTPSMEVCGYPCIVSQTGYTGEFGYEIYMPNEAASVIYEALLKEGEEFGIMPCGLGARDTLRMEAAMPLYGHEMDETVHPLETGLNFGVKMKKETFIGKSGIEARMPAPRKRIGLKVTGRGIVREHSDLFLNGELIGHTTSGTHCPYLGCAIAMALVDSSKGEIGDKVEVEVRGRKIECEIVALPFYKRAK